jgi:hypothetical protein
MTRLNPLVSTFAGSNSQKYSRLMTCGEAP